MHELFAARDHFLIFLRATWIRHEIDEHEVDVYDNNFSLIAKLNRISKELYHIVILHTNLVFKKIAVANLK